MQNTVIGMFRNTQAAEAAAERLRASGFPDEYIDVTSSPVDTSYTSNETHEASSLDRDDTTYMSSDETRLNESSTAYDSSETFGSSQSYNRDRVRDNDDSFGDSIGRFFRNLFDNKEEAEKFTTVGRNNSIVTVYANTNEEAERAAEILDECGAIDIDESASQYGNYSRDESHQLNASGEYERENLNSPDLTTDRTIPIIEENINIGKQEMESGSMRLRSKVIERPVEESLRLREERIRIERNPVNRPATQEDFETFQEGEVTLTERSEVPHVNKEARVVEEVRINKEVSEHDETVRDTVRKTDVEVENIEGTKVKKGRGKSTK